jgi:diacylglycerol kinase (ATP)
MTLAAAASSGMKREDVGRRALLLVNPHSRRGATGAAKVGACLRDTGLELVCADGTEAVTQIRRHARNVGQVVIGGGGGLLNAAVPALLETGLPLGVMPLGTANDFARTLGIPIDPRQAAQVIVDSWTTPIDVGEANGQPFLNVASIGFGVDLTRALSRDSKRRWGILGYAVAGLRVLRRLKPFTASIEVGGRTQLSRTVHLAIGNGRHYGGGMIVDQHARLDDGRLHAFSLEVDHWWRLLLMLPSLRKGTHHAWAEVCTMAGEELIVRTRHPRSVNLDGEIKTRTPVTVRVRPGALRVFVPRP